MSGWNAAPAAYQYAPDLCVEPVHMDVHLVVAPGDDAAALAAVGVPGDLAAAAAACRDGCGLASRSVAVSVEVEFECRHVPPEGVRTAKLDGVGFRGLTVAACGGGSAAGDESAVSFAYDGRVVAVTWTKGFAAAGERRRVRAVYRVEKPVTGLTFSAPSASRPHRGLHVISDHETQRARYWLLCNDEMSVRPTMRFDLTHPQGMTSLANGVRPTASEDAERTAGGLTTTRWVMEQRVPAYLVAVAIGELVRVPSGGQGFKGVPIELYTEAGHASLDNVEGLAASFGGGQTERIMEWLTTLVGQPFPYPKYFQIALPLIGGAMECVSLTTWDQTFVLTAPRGGEGYRAERQWDAEMINVHEMTHSFFGDTITCRDFEAVWLKEGWATLTPILWGRDKYGSGVYGAGLLRIQDRYFAETRRGLVRRTVNRTFDQSWTAFDMHAYAGAGWRIHMLSRQLGDDAFWKGVQAYVAKHMGTVVEVVDFQRALEAAAPGRNLTRFFDQWFRSPGHPIFAGALTWDADLGVATVTLRQVQHEEGSGSYFPKDAGVSLFHVRIPVVLHAETGESVRLVLETGRDGSVGTYAASASQSAALPSRPVRFELDPELTTLFDVASFKAGEELWTNALCSPHDVPLDKLQAADATASHPTHYERASTDRSWTDARMSLWAFRHLLSDVGTSSAVSAACDWLTTGVRKKTVHYYARASAFGALVKSGACRAHSAAVDAVASVIASETHALARRDMFIRAGSLPVDPRVREALLTALPSLPGGDASSSVAATSASAAASPAAGDGAAGGVVVGHAAWGAMLRELGAQRGGGSEAAAAADLDLLKRYAEAGRSDEQPGVSLHGLVQGGAFRGAGNLGSSEALQFLMRTLRDPALFLSDAVEGGCRVEAQGALVSAVAAAAAAQPAGPQARRARAEAADTIVQAGCLQVDRGLPLHLAPAALAALAGPLRATSHLPTLRAFAAAANNQDAADAVRRIKAMEARPADDNASAPPAAAALAALERRIRELEEKAAGTAAAASPAAAAAQTSQD